jgi:hypothetical protein
MKVIAVNGRKFTPQVFRMALKAGTTSSKPLRLLVLNGDYYKTCTIDYNGGEKFPHLVRETNRPDLLDEMLKPLAAH